MQAPSPPDGPDEEWCAHHFDHLGPELAGAFHGTLEQMRTHHPVAHSDAHGGFWAVTGYDEVLAVAQDWETFSSEHGITVPSGPAPIPAIPEQLDPPRHREFKRLINAYFTPAKVLEQEDAARALVDRLIDGFVEAGTCEFMTQFAKPLPGLVFFDMFLHAPPEEVEEVNRLASTASTPTTREAREARGAMIEWIREFVGRRRTEGPRGDVVDAVIAAEIEGRPITEDEIVGVIQLLLFGGLDTTAGALGAMMIRFCREPDIADLLRARPELIPDAVEELLRLDGPFVFIARTAKRDTEVGGQSIKEGDPVLVSWVSANRDEREFGCPGAFDLERSSNRHIAFGAGPHRCAGSNLARMNLRIAVSELLGRLGDLRLQDDAPDPLPFHSAYSRAPEVVPIAFTPGPRLG
jgi:cytochrome P450